MRDANTSPLPTSPDAMIAAICGENDWCCTRQQLLSAGLAPATIDRRVTSGLITRMHRGVFALTPAAEEATTRWRAATLARPDGVLSHASAAAAHGWPIGHLDVRGPIHLTTERTKSARTIGVTMHRTRHLPADDRSSVGSTPCTTPSRTLLDLIPHMSKQRLSHLGDQLLSGAFAQTPSRFDIEACALGLARRGRAGTVARREYVSTLSSGDEHELSHAERLFRNLCDEHAIVGLIAQFTPPWFDGIRGVVDFACPIRKVIFEIDGRAFHSLRSQIDEDRRRDRLAREHGYRIERIGYAELVARPDAMMHLVKTVLAAAASHVAA